MKSFFCCSMNWFALLRRYGALRIGLLSFTNAASQAVEYLKRLIYEIADMEDLCGAVHDEQGCQAEVWCTSSPVVCEEIRKAMFDAPASRGNGPTPTAHFKLLEGNGIEFESIRTPKKVYSLKLRCSCSHAMLRLSWKGKRMPFIRTLTSVSGYVLVDSRCIY